MKVSELAQKYSCHSFSLSSSNSKFIMQLVYLGIGFLLSGGTIFDSYSPFGISLTAAVPFTGIFSSFIGSFAGYIVFSAGKSNFRYIAAMIAVIAIRWTLNDIKKLNRHSLYSAAVCALPTAATGFAVMSVSGFNTPDTIVYIIEAVIGGAAAFFFSRTFIILNGTKTVGMLLPQETACLILSGCIGILSLSGITIGTISFGHVIAAVCILFAAKFGGVFGSSVAGISSGIVLSLASEEYYFIGAAFAFGGLMSGLFAPAGRIAAGIALVLGSSVVSLQSGNAASVINMIYETFAAGTIFAIIPKSTGSFISALFRTSKKDEHCEGLRRSVIMRLDFASKALSDVSANVEEVAEKLSGVVTPTLENVYQKAVDETCKRCGMRVFCWEHHDGISLEAFGHVSEKLRRDGCITADDFRSDIKQKCCRSVEMAAAVNKCYKSYLASEAASKRVDEIRSVVAGQFCGLGDILGEMADEYENYEYFDNELSERLFIKFKELGLTPIDISCRVDHVGRMNIEAEIYDEDRKKLKRALMIHEISKLCGRRFDIPGITAAFGRCRIVFCEKPSLDVEIASSQHVCSSGRLCGDNFRYFNDGMGRMITVLSDGMGTGGRAAVDSGMAVSIMSKLIKAGLGFDCSLKVVNSALMVKSEDESLATLDVVSIDMYTGTADFMKAGAALSFIRKDGEMYRAESPSLPAGILTDVEFAYTEDELSENDIIVMVSDGAVSSGEEWIERIIMRWDEKSMQELADLINDEAAARRTDGHDDDITVIAMRIKKR